MNDWMEDAGLSWWTRRWLGLGRKTMTSGLLKLFTGKPGLMRSILAAYIVAVIVLKALGQDQIADTLGNALAWVGLTPGAIGAPVDPAAIGAAALALVALARPFVRWVIAGFTPAK